MIWCHNYLTADEGPFVDTAGSKAPQSYLPQYTHGW